MSVSVSSTEGVHTSFNPVSDTIMCVAYKSTLRISAGSWWSIMNLRLPCFPMSTKWPDENIIQRIVSVCTPFWSSHFNNNNYSSILIIIRIEGNRNNKNKGYHNVWLDAYEFVGFVRVDNGLQSEHVSIAERWTFTLFWKSHVHFETIWHWYN